jgi:hypothetical protein
MGRYSEVGKLLLGGGKQQINCSEDEWQYVKKVTRVNCKKAIGQE